MQLFLTNCLHILEILKIMSEKSDSMENPFEDSQNIDDQLPSVDLNTGFTVSED